MKLNRRNFLKLSGLATLALPFLASLRGSNAIAADLPACTETDPTAKGMGYCTDGKKCPARTADKATQTCKNCQLYTKISGDGDKEIGKCLVLSKCTVAAGAWCKSWVKNPKVS